MFVQQSHPAKEYVASLQFVVRFLDVVSTREVKSQEKSPSPKHLKFDRTIKQKPEVILKPWFTSGK